MTNPLNDSTVMMLPKVRQIQLVVEYLTNQTRFYTIRDTWRVNTMTREIIIGKGLPRTHIPLDTVAAYHVEEIR